jgi:hypothetical protein
LLPADLRVSCIGPWCLAFNFSDHEVSWQPVSEAKMLLGTTHIPPQGMSVWRSAS